MITATDELRIIADEKRLTPADREEIRAAATLIERLEEMLVETQRELIASQGHRIALTEQLIEARRQAPPFPQPVTYTTLLSGLVWCDTWWKYHQMRSGIGS